jgi:hypothetical protein
LGGGANVTTMRGDNGEPMGYLLRRERNGHCNPFDVWMGDAPAIALDIQNASRAIRR